MKFKILALALLLVMGVHAFASEGGEGGEGGEGKKESGAADKPWVEVENRVSAMRTKTKQLEGRLHELIEEKKKTTDSQRMYEVDREIDKTYKEYKSSNEDLRRQEEIFKYRFPEKAAKEGDRVYHTQDVPSLEHIEEQVGVEGKLHRNMIRMRKQYGRSGQKGENASKPEATPTPNPEDQKTIREQDSPILKK